VDCAEARDRLVEAVETELSGEGRRSLEEHLAQCGACRAEFRDLQKASSTLRGAVQELAPAQTYLTGERLASLMASYGRLTADYRQERRIFSLLTYRRFVAAAAAAAILVSAAFIAASFVRMRRLQRAEPVVRGEAVPSPYVRVVVAAMGQGEPVNVVRSIPVGPTAWPLGEQPARGAQLVRAESLGVRVPVDHAFYDPEESSQWW